MARSTRLEAFESSFSLPLIGQLLVIQDPYWSMFDTETPLAHDIDNRGKEIFESRYHIQSTTNRTKQSQIRKRETQ